MSLSCACPDGDSEDWFYMGGDDYTTLQTTRRKRCCSCKELIDVGAICIKFEIFRYPEQDSIEEKIYGEGCEIQKADQYHCEKCADIYFSLDELGYCTGLGDDMRELVKEYADQKQWEAEQKRKVIA